MYLSHDDKRFRDGVGTAKTLAGMQNLYDSAKRFGKQQKFLAISLILAALTPFVVYSIRRQRKRHKKTLGYLKKALTTTQGYEQFKHLVTEMEDILPQLEKYSDYKMSNAPWLIRRQLRVLQKQSKSILTMASWINHHLDKYNKEKFVAQNPSIKFIPETELWKDRNTAYSYWI